ncbi:hypothetical protein ALC57_11849, partial [Trachymyrmex cornetzi]
VNGSSRPGLRWCSGVAQEYEDTHLPSPPLPPVYATLPREFLRTCDTPHVYVQPPPRKPPRQEKQAALALTGQARASKYIRISLWSNREIRAACPRICGSASRSSGYTSSPLTETGDLVVDVHWNRMRWCPVEIQLRPTTAKFSPALVLRREASTGAARITIDAVHEINTITPESTDDGYALPARLLPFRQGTLCESSS